MLLPPGRFYNRAPGEILHTALKQHLDDYDWVIIDCPPNLGLITLNGLRDRRRLRHPDHSGCALHLRDPADHEPGEPVLPRDQRADQGFRHRDQQVPRAG